MANDNLIQLIKRIALDAVKSSKPCDIITGIVEKSDPLEIKISEKVTLDRDFFYMTKTTMECGLKKGDKVAIMRANGGQKYFVLDKVV